MVGAMKKTRDYYDYEPLRSRSIMVKLCDYGVVILLLSGVVYSTYLDIEARFKPTQTKVLTAKQTASIAQSTIE
jgi:hypothetical protein